MIKFIFASVAYTNKNEITKAEHYIYISSNKFFIAFE